MMLAPWSWHNMNEMNSSHDTVPGQNVTKNICEKRSPRPTVAVGVDAHEQPQQRRPAVVRHLAKRLHEPVAIQALQHKFGCNNWN
jgi:hypothetical protein